MEKLELATLLDEGLSIREISARIGLSYTTTRYWMRKHELKANYGPHGKRFGKALYRCRCGETDPAHFYGKKFNICANCHNKYVINRGRQTKVKIIKHLGGVCSNPRCGFFLYRSALTIHHLDPAKKDPSFRSYRGWSWARIEKEIEGCILLCACCHIAVHAGELTIDWYNIEDLCLL
jgi:hypothetical protein